jgi:hypothetical protein
MILRNLVEFKLWPGPDLRGSAESLVIDLSRIVSFWEVKDQLGQPAPCVKISLSNGEVFDIYDADLSVQKLLGEFFIKRMVPEKLEKR